MLAAGLVAKKAVEKGLTVRPYIKTTLSPGSGVVKEYFKIAGVQDALDKLGFRIPMLQKQVWRNIHEFKNHVF